MNFYGSCHFLLQQSHHQCWRSCCGVQSRTLLQHRTHQIATTCLPKIPTQPVLIPFWHIPGSCRYPLRGCFLSTPGSKPQNQGNWGVSNHLPCKLRTPHSPSTAGGDLASDQGGRRRKENGHCGTPPPSRWWGMKEWKNQKDAGRSNELGRNFVYSLACQSPLENARK